MSKFPKVLTPFKKAKGTETLLPEEAVRRFNEDPSNLFFTFDQIMLNEGLTLEELLAELRSGRLVAVLLAGDTTPLVQADHLLSWMTERELKGLRKPPAIAS
jgi:hypothetical protein